jgi:hypothetical protein
MVKRELKEEKDAATEGSPSAPEGPEGLVPLSEADWQRLDRIVLFRRAEQLADYLNNYREGPQWSHSLLKRDRVFRLFQYCQQLELLRQEGFPGIADARRNPEARKRLRRLATLLHRISQILALYRFTPGLGVEEEGFRVMWRPIAVEIVGGRATVPPGEAPYVQTVLELAVAGRLNQVRRCEALECGRWFATTINKKVVCSDACRFRKYQAKLEVKEKRKKYMRTYFRNPRVKARLKKKRDALQT